MWCPSCLLSFSSLQIRRIVYTTASFRSAVKMFNSWGQLHQRDSGSNLGSSLNLIVSNNRCYCCRQSSWDLSLNHVGATGPCTKCVCRPSILHDCNLPNITVCHRHALAYKPSQLLPLHKKMALIHSKVGRDYAWLTITRRGTSRQLIEWTFGLMSSETKHLYSIYYNFSTIGDWVFPLIPRSFSLFCNLQKR